MVTRVVARKVLTKLVQCNTWWRQKGGGGKAKGGGGKAKGGGAGGKGGGAGGGRG